MRQHTLHVASPGALAIRTNDPELKWSFGVNIPTASEADYDACAVKMDYWVDDSVETAPGSGGKYHYFSGMPGADSLRYDRALLGKRRIGFELAGVSQGSPSLTVNRNYAKFITHRFMNLHSAGYIMTDLAGLQLLRSGFSPVHCAAFRYEGATVLILAAPNTGKTLTSMMACMEFGAEFLAEDIAITDGTRIYGVPHTSTFRYYDRIDQSRRSRIWGQLTNVVPPLELIPATKTRSVDSYVAPSKILDSSEVTHVVVLERGAEAVRDADREDVRRKAINLNRYEFAYAQAPTLVAYEFFNPEIDLEGAAQRERTIMTSLVDHAERRMVVTSLDATRFAPLILDALGRE